MRETMNVWLILHCPACAHCQVVIVLWSRRQLTSKVNSSRRLQSEYGNFIPGGNSRICRRRLFALQSKVKSVGGSDERVCLLNLNLSQVAEYDNAYQRRHAIRQLASRVHFGPKIKESRQSCYVGGRKSVCLHFSRRVELNALEVRFITIRDSNNNKA